jgi:hypothetical protein
VLEPSTVEMSRLQRAAAEVPVKRIRAVGTVRRPPAASTAEVLDIAAAALAAAKGTLTETQLMKLMQARLPWAVQDLAGPELDEAVLGQWESESAEGVMLAESDAAATEKEAVAIVSQLTERERVAVAVGRGAAGDLCAALGVGKSQAATIRKRAESLVGDLAAKTSDPRSVGELVISLCKHLRQITTDDLAASASSLIPAPSTGPVIDQSER